jgi:hypothetical protein
MSLPYHRLLRLGSFGYDVWGAKRATYRALRDEAKWQGFLHQTTLSKKTFGPFFARDLKILDGQLSVHDQPRSVFDELMLRALETGGAFDAIASGLWLHQYAPPPVPKLIEPKQGFQSLVSDLWGDYSIGRRMGMTDLGTYNPASILPDSHQPSDHATSRLDGRIGEPACAFDLGISPQNGYDNPVGRKFFDLMIGRKEIHYVILGTKIWSTDQGLHEYTAGGHEGHVHTSGHRR